MFRVTINHTQILRSEHRKVLEHFKALESMQCNCDANSSGNIAMTDNLAVPASAAASAESNRRRDRDIDSNADASESNGRVFMRGVTCPCAIQCLSELQEHVCAYV